MLFVPRDYGRLGGTEPKIRTGGTIRQVYTNHHWSVYLQLFNFLQNAIQAEAKDIVISADTLPLSKPQRAYLGRNGGYYELGDHFIHVAMADNGTGIPRRELPDLFAPRDPSSKRGVGLSLVDYVCDTIHGYVTVESTVGEGSTFTLTFAQERKNRA